MDGVVIDTINFVSAELTKYFNREIKPDDVAHNLGKIDGIIKIFMDKGEYLLCSLDPMEYAVVTINKIAEEHEVYIVSARFQIHYDMTMEWIRRHGIKVHEVIFTEGKGKADICKKKGIDLFIEDSVANSIELADNGIKVILFSTEYNSCLNRDDIIRCDSWTSILKSINEFSLKEVV